MAATWTVIISVAGGLGTIITLVKLLIAPILKSIKDIRQHDKAITDALERLRNDVERLEKKTDENEKDRIRREVFYNGSRLRRGESINTETFRSLQIDVDKYFAMGGNGIVKEEWDYIRAKFNA